MKKDYIIPTIFFIKYEEESKLLSNSLQGDANSTFAAPDAPHNSMDGSTDLSTDNTGSVSEGDYAKKTDWFFDDNAFSDF
ncbi:hypothetical protein KUA50_011090 [Segatella hominis]|uniref:hypothetical protein n=1 Tax=Segatella hominis TaxID=2518605 RepID=UPI001C450844|nr:hypothetical protein [Segatella hominis]WOZ80602.1 hypothetical protein KUA50_011090 [Segatella hominis]